MSTEDEVKAAQKILEEGLAKAKADEPIVVKWITTHVIAVAIITFVIGIAVGHFFK